MLDIIERKVQIFTTIIIKIKTFFFASANFRRNIYIKSTIEQ